jgi:protein phosphatase
MIFRFSRKNKEAKPITLSNTECFYKAVSATDIGRIRNKNEDRVTFYEPKDANLLQSKGYLGIVADGIGGNNCGEVASQMAIDLVPSNYYKSASSIETSLQKAFKQANEEILKRANMVEGHLGMGTTCTTIVLQNDDLYLAHLGDSRAYLVNEKQITRLSRDDSFVQQLLDEGLISEKQAKNHPKRNIITKSLGSEKNIQPDVKHFKSVMGEEDLIFLCTDGLHEYVNDEEIRTILMNQEMKVASETLVELANERGGHDNISLLIIGQKLNHGQQNISER